MLAPGALVHPCPGDLGWGGPLAGRGWTATGWWTFTTGTGPGPMEADGGTAACRGGELDDEEDLKVAYTRGKISTAGSPTPPKNNMEH